MLRQPTLDLLHELRLAGMAQAFEDRLSLLLEREKTERSAATCALRALPSSTSTRRSKTSTSRPTAASTVPSFCGLRPDSGSRTARPCSSAGPPGPVSPTWPAPSAPRRILLFRTPRH